MNRPKISDLPTEIFAKIFNQIYPIKQLVQLKLVCKRWYSIAINLRVKNLVISSSSLSNSKYWYTYNYIDFSYLIKNDQDLDAIQLKLSQPLFDNLKSLYIYGVHDKVLFTNFLNRFQFLEHLEVVYSKLKDDDKNRCTLLNLKNLRILNISDAINDVIILDTPRLVRFRLSLTNYDSISIKHPESIQYFETYRFINLIKTFTNLEHLFVRNISQLDGDFLSNLSRLKEIHFDGKKDVFYDLRKQKKLFKRNEVKLFYFGINSEDSIPKHELMNNRHQINVKAIEFYRNNYNQMAIRLPFAHQIDYSLLEQCFGDQIPSCFIRRFVNLDYLIVTQKVKYSNQLIQILNDCGNLKSFTIYSLLDQTFFCQLPDILPFLEYLIIKNEQNLNYNEFLFNFNNNLKLIYIKNNLSIDFAFNIVRRLFDKYNELIFGFIYQDKLIRILHCKSNELKLEIANQQNSILIKSNFDNLDDLFVFLNAKIS